MIVFPPSLLLRTMFTRRASQERRPLASTPVFLNVYDLSSVNGYAYWLGFGVYHSGVQVHGVEYAYGAHEHAATGIFDGEPRRCPGFVFRKAILIGRTDMGPREVRELVEDMAAEYSGSAYNLISKNCNHFWDDACFRLTGKPIPKLVNRLATIEWRKCGSAGSTMSMASCTPTSGDRAATPPDSLRRSPRRPAATSRSLRSPSPPCRRGEGGSGAPPRCPTS